MHPLPAPGTAAEAALCSAVLADAALAFVGVPGIARIDGGDLVRTIAPGRPQPYVNVITRLTLPPAAVAARVREVEADYRAAGLPTLWWVDDAGRAAGLLDALRATGMRDPGHETVMTLALPAGGGGRDADPGSGAGRSSAPVTVRVVETIDALDDWIGVMAAAYGWSDPARAALMQGLYDPRLPHGRDGARIVLLARIGGVPVGAGSLFRAAGQGWITNVGTVPDARGRGVGAAVTGACLRLAAERGDPSAWLAASAMGAPLYARLGFRAAGRIDHLVGPAPR